jgi:hypothetical protein
LIVGNMTVPDSASETVHRPETIWEIASRGDDDNVEWRVRPEGVTAVFWLTAPALVDVLAAASGSAALWRPSRGDAGSGRQR